MMTLNEAGRVVDYPASATSKDAGLIHIMTEETIDPDSRDSLRVILVVDTQSKIVGDFALENLIRSKQELRRARENRFAYVEYTTEEDIAEPR